MSDIYNFDVIVTDDGKGKLSAKKAVIVNIIDVNDQPDVISPKTGFILENADVQTVIYLFQQVHFCALSRLLL